MGQYFATDYQGEPFILFGAAHLITLGVIALGILLVIAMRHRFTPAGRRRFRTGLGVVLVVNELAWHAWNLFTGQWTVQTMLPFHLCSVLVWVSAYMLFTRNYRIYEFAYFLGIAGAIQALLTPDAGIYGFPHFRFLQTMLAHASIVTAALYMTVVEGYRPTWKSLGRVFLWGNIYMLLIMLLNRLIGSNYLFIAHKPETASLIDMLGAWPVYIFWLEVLAVVLCLLLYLPYAIRDWREKRLAEAAAP